ncbi:putative signal transducing protein [Thermodesulfobacteriota bacterium]
MYCPVCRAEYREGFKECTDCDVYLVEELAPLEDMPGFVKLATIFNEGDIAVIKTCLDKTGIEYYFDGEQSHRLAPVPLAARLMVREDFRSEAESILRDLELL